MGKFSRSEYIYRKSIKYINKNKDLIKHVNFLNAATEGEKNPLTEIRKIKHTAKLVSVSIGGHQSDTNIAQHFFLTNII